MMEESIPLESSSKKTFENKVSGIKKLLKKGKNAPNQKKLKPDTNGKHGNKGVVYIAHIPHGFYEKQMQSFFKQFGTVTNVRVARSKRNGRSKGYAFVEFEDKEVAEIVAETMNNYLMDKRLLKAECIPAARQHANMFKGTDWVENKICPGLNNRKKNKMGFNKDISDEDWIKECKQHLNRIYSTQKKLKELGIDFSFTPSDVPESLKNYDPSSKPEVQQDKNTQKNVTNENNTKKTGESVGNKDNKNSKSKKSAKNPIADIVVQTKIVEGINSIKTKQGKKKANRKNNKLEKPEKMENKLHATKVFGGIQKNIVKKKGPLSKIQISKDDSLQTVIKSDATKISKKKKGFSKK
ncbi:uncharacterized protein LOC143917781 [Arctopsyche grandis]|uniref:uncharacterized protein LOC143917781 n=1 Tax=Arctopsyche grandis TaxID=121162 RepID=UPI00406D709F